MPEAAAVPLSEDVMFSSAGASLWLLLHRKHIWCNSLNVKTDARFQDIVMLEGTCDETVTEMRVSVYSSRLMTHIVCGHKAEGQCVLLAYRTHRLTVNRVGVN